MNRDFMICNLDPAINSAYNYNIDIRDLITLDDVMLKFNLGYK